MRIRKPKRMPCFWTGHLKSHSLKITLSTSIVHTWQYITLGLLLFVLTRLVYARILIKLATTKEINND